MRARFSLAALIIVFGLCFSIPTAVGAAGTPQTGSPVSLADLAGSFSGTTTPIQSVAPFAMSTLPYPTIFDAAYSGSARRRCHQSPYPRVQLF